MVFARSQVSLMGKITNLKAGAPAADPHYLRDPQRLVGMPLVHATTRGMIASGLEQSPSLQICSFLPVPRGVELRPATFGSFRWKWKAGQGGYQ